MAEAVSIAAGIAALLKTLVTVTKEINDIRNANEQVVQIRNELTCTSAILHGLQVTLVNKDASNKTRRGWKVSTQFVLDNIAITVGDLQKRLKGGKKRRSRMSMTFFRRVKWVYSKEDTYTLLEQLRGYIRLLMLSQQGLVEENVDKLLHMTAEIRDLISAGRVKEGVVLYPLAATAATRIMVDSIPPGSTIRAVPLTIDKKSHATLGTLPTKPQDKHEKSVDSRCDIEHAKRPNDSNNSSRSDSICKECGRPLTDQSVPQTIARRPVSSARDPAHPQVPSRKYPRVGENELDESHDKSGYRGHHYNAKRRGSDPNTTLVHSNSSMLSSEHDSLLNNPRRLQDKSKADTEDLYLKSLRPTGQYFIGSLTESMAIDSLAFSPDGKIFATAGGYSLCPEHIVVKLWDASTGRELRKMKLTDATWLHSMIFSPDGNMIATACASKHSEIFNSVTFWAPSTGEELYSLEGFRGEAYALAFSPCDGLIATADKRVQLWEVGTGRHLRTIHGLERYTNCVSFSPNGRLIGSADNDGSSVTGGAFKVWEVDTGRLLYSISGHGRQVTSLAFSPDSKIIMNGGWEVNLWDASTGQKIRSLAGQPWSHERSDPQPETWCSEAIFSPDGKVLATVGGSDGCGDGAVKLWESDTGHLLHSLDGHKIHVGNVDFSPDGKVLLTGGSRLGDHGYWGEVKLWDVSHLNSRSA